ncbi:MAG: cyclic nucleotide-binding domain-containing protein, partial [Candidatus Hydrogenedentota bacterium]
TIFAEGSEQDSLFIMLSGKVRITKATQSGEQKSIATLGAGSFFGEMALFDDYVRSATATVVNKARSLEISKEAFMKFLSSDAVGASKLMLEIMRTVAPRIRQTNRELVALYEAGRIIGERAELGEILSNLLAVLADATSCTRGVVFLLNSAAGLLECRAAFGYDADPENWTEPLEGGVAEEIIRAEDPIKIEDFRQEPAFESIQPVGYETSSMLCTALRTRGQVTGTIVLCDKVAPNGKPSPFTPGDANVLAGIAAQASGAIESARLHEEAQEKEKLDRVYFRH